MNTSLLLKIVALVVGVLLLESAITYYGVRREPYLSANKPSFQPPPIVFSLAWLILFALYAYAWYTTLTHVSEESAKEVNLAFGLGLLFNFLWVVAFFGYFSTAIALFILFVMIVFTALLLVPLFKTHPPAAVAIGIYLLWLCFAFVLNYNYL